MSSYKIVSRSPEGYVMVDTQAWITQVLRWDFTLAEEIIFADSRLWHGIKTQLN